MTAAEEKPEVDQQSAEVAKTSGSLKEKDAENPMAGYIPQADEEYNVTLKTWCVVLVSCPSCASQASNSLRAV